MDLQELKFRVETKELDDAITKVGELGEAVSKLNTPVAQLAKNTKDAAKSAGDLAQAADKSGKSSKDLADSTDAVNDRLQKLKDQLSFLRNDLNLSETGLTKMQAGLMSSMKAIGATDTQLKSFASTFDQFNRLMGEQAFDKSVAGLNMLNRQMKEFEIVNELAARGANLTSTQVKQLTRDIEALRQQNQEFGRGANDGVEELKTKYITAANSVNQYVAAAKEAEQAAKREAQAAIEAAKAHDANNAAIARQYELVRQSAWKEYAANVGTTSSEIKALSGYYNTLQKEIEQANAAIDKQNATLRSSVWKEYAGTIGQTSPELKKMADYYRALESDSAKAAAAIDKQNAMLRQAAWKEYATGVGQTSAEMKKLNAYFKEQEKAAGDLENQRFKALGVEKQVAATKKQILDEATKAQQYMTRETEKLIFVNEKLAQGFGTASANALFKYQEALQKTGRTADQVEKELADLGKELMKKQGTSPISMIQKDVQKLDQSVNHLARNIGVQFTDIFVSLANGQSIFQVVTQQGGQLADAFLLAGISGQNMGNQLVEGAKAIFNSYKVLGSAFLDLGGRAIKGAGEAVVDFGMKITGTKAIVDSYKRSLASMGEEGFAAIGQITRLGALAASVAGTIMATLVVALVAAAVAFVQLSKEQDTLAKSLAQFGGTFGVTTEQAIALSKSLNNVGVTSSEAVGAITEMAKAGNLGKDSFEGIATAAVNAQRYVGIAVKDTVKQFSELVKEPIKVLTEFGIQTGYVSAEQLKLVQDLLKVGDTAGATKTAIGILQEGYTQMAENAKRDTSALGSAMTELKRLTSLAWDEFKNSETVVLAIGLITKSLQGAVLFVSRLTLGVKTLTAFSAAIIDSANSGKPLLDTWKMASEQVAEYTAEYEKLKSQFSGEKIPNAFDLKTPDQRAADADALEVARDRAKLEKSVLGSVRDQAKELSKSAYIQKRMQEELKAAGPKASYTPELESAAIKKFGKEWTDAQDKVKEASSSMQVSSNNLIANTEKRFNTQLRLAQNFASNDLVIEKARLDAGLITQEEYYSNTIGLIEQGEKEQLSVIDKYSAEYQTAVQDRLVQLSSAYIQTINNNRGLKGEVEKNAQATVKYNQDVENVLNSLQTFTERNDALRQSIENNGIVRDIQNLGKHKKAIDDSRQALEKYTEEYRKIGEGADKEIESLDQRLSLLGKTEEEQKALNRQFTLQNKLTQIQLDLERRLREIRNDPKLAGNAMDAAVAEYEAIEAAKKQRIAANKEVAVLASEDYQKEFEKIQGTITDIIATALFEGGKAGQKKLKDVLKASFRKFVIDVFINPVVKAGMNLVLDAVGLGGGSSSALSMGSNALSLSGLGSTITSGIATGFAEASAGAAFVGPSATLAPGATGFGAQIGSTLSAMGPVGWAALAIGALLLSGFGETPGEQHMGGMYSTRGSELNMETARSITGGGGWDDGAWARDLTERSSDEVTTAVGKIVDGALGDVNTLIENFGLGKFTIDAGMAANVNGEGTDKNVFGYFNLYDEAGNLVKEYVNRELGTDLAEAVKKFGGDIQEAVASVVLEGTNFKREGETNVQTLARLSTSLTAVNQVADLLGMKSLDLSLAGGDAASSLVDLFGSIENLQSASKSFYDQFASDTTKLADAQSLLDTTFSTLGYSIPETKEQYYQLVRGLDLNTEAGRKAYAALLGVGDAFLYVEDSAERAAEAERQRQEQAYQEQQRAAEQARQDAQRAAEEAEKARIDLINKSYSALEKAVNKQKAALQAQFDLAKQIYDIAIQAVRELRGQVAGTNQLLTDQARELISNVISTGVLPDPAKLSEAIAKVREELQTTRYKSKVEQDRATLLLSLELEKIANIAEPQMTTAELQLKALTDMLEQQKALVDAALGNVEATLSVEQALANLAAALSAPSGGSGGGSSAGWGGVQNTPTQVQSRGFKSGVTKDVAGVYNSGYESVNNGVYTYSSGVSDASGFSAGPSPSDTLTSSRPWTTVGYATKNPDVVDYYNANKALIAELGQASSLLDYLNYHFITYGIEEGRQFANGGAFTNGIVQKPTNFNMGQMGEAGPEAIMPLTNVGGRLGVQSTSSPELVNAIDRMNSNIEMLRSEIRADVTHNSKTSRLLDRVIQDGRSINVTASIDGGAV